MFSYYDIVGPGNGSPSATNVFLLLGVLVVIGFSKYQSFFISLPIVIKLRTQSGDNILHNRTVSDFQLTS